MTDKNLPSWVKKALPYESEEEQIEAYEIYRSYRDEGQSHIVSLAYAGMGKEPVYED